MDVRKRLLEDLKHKAKDQFDKNLIAAYAKNFDYKDLEQTFRDQLSKEVSCEDEA